MSCTPPVRTITVAARHPVFSKGGSTNEGENTLFELGGEELMQIAPMLAGIRATIRVENATDDLKTKVVWQSTNDGETWTAGGDFDSTFQTGNRDTTSNWDTDVNKFERGIRFGVLARQANSNTMPQFGLITVIVDLLLRS